MILGDTAGIVAGSPARSSASARSAESFPGRVFAEGNFRLAGHRRPKMSQGETARGLAFTPAGRVAAIAKRAAPSIKKDARLTTKAGARKGLR